MAVKIIGLDNVLRNLDKEIKQINGGTMEGMRKVGLFIENESNESTPQDKGVLINSSFSGVAAFAGKIIARVGYTAKYAPFVHEMPKSNNFTKPGTGPKFLEKAVKNNFNAILKIIQQSAKVK